MSKEIIWKKGKNKKTRSRKDYNISITSQIHPDASKALDQMGEKYQWQYSKKHLLSMSILVLDSLLKNNQIEPHEDIEKILGI